MELSETVKAKLAEFVEAIAEESLNGMPALLANCLYVNLERETIKQLENIKQEFE